MPPRFLPLVAAATLTPLAAGQSLYVVESTNDVVVEVSAIDGVVLDPAFIDIALLTGGLASTPIEMIFAPNGEIWITDQLADAVFRFSADGSTYLGVAPAALDNVRGGDVLGANVLVTNSGSQNGAPGDALVELDGGGALVSSTAIGDPFDAEPFTLGGVPGYLVSDIAGEDLVFVDASDLSNQTVFHDSDGVNGIDFPEQIHVSATGRIWVGGFTLPSGIYEYDSTGAQVQYIDTSALGFGGVRGVAELGNGNLLFTTGSGIHVYEVGTGTVATVLMGVSGRFVSGAGASGGIGSNYCAANANSTGAAATMGATGSSIVANDDLTLACDSMPQNAFAFFLTSRTQGFTANPGGSAGNLCLGGAIGRFVGPGQIQNSGAAGSVTLLTDLSQQPTPTGFVSVMPGETWSYQCWFRDAVGGSATSNFSDGLEISFQ